MPRTERIKELLSYVAEVAPELRRDVLVQRFPDDKALYDEVLDLAGSYDAASDDFLDPLIERHGDPGPFGFQVPPQIGPYKIGRLLGRGATGAVYEGVQATPVRRRVAIKVLNTAGDPDAIQLRFGIERDALCRLEHPGIAKVLDAGLSSDGVPYIATEIVDGPSVTEYAERNRLSLRARLELLRDVALAVHHAHSRALLHRDLKPSNILVETHDGRAIPKVIDFGVAKLLDQPGGTSQKTLSGQIIGTPGYMAPEQASAITGDIDVRVDVFALGVILYELLTGALPFVQQSSSSGGGLAATERAKRAKPPSNARGSTGVTGLTSELDCLVLKAIELDRELRYRTALDLADDIERYLAGLTINARPPTKAYLLRKFVQRNKFATLFGLLAMMAIVGGLVASLFLLERSNRDRDRLREQQQATAQALVDADSTLDLLDTLLASTDPVVDGPDVRLRDVLDRAIDVVEGADQRSPAVVARSRLILGRTYASLGQWPQARDVLVPVVDQPLGSTAPDQRVEAAIALGEAQYRSSDFADAVETLRRAVEQARGIDDASLEWRASMQLANALQLLREPDEAGQIYDRLLRDAREGQVAVPDVDVATAQMSSGVLMHKRGERDAGMQLVDASVATLEQSVGRGHPSWSTAVHNRAVLLMAGGDLEGARDGLLVAITAWRDLVGPEHVNTLNAMVQLGDVHRRLGDMDAAEELLTQAVPLIERTLGPSNRLTLKGLQDLAELFAARGEWSDAVSQIDRVMEIHAEFSGEDDPRTWYARAQHARYAGEAGQLEDVRVKLLEIEREAVQRFGEENRFTRAIRQMVLQEAKP